VAGAEKQYHTTTPKRQPSVDGLASRLPIRYLQAK
jgi:hypothetical protein